MSTKRRSSKDQTITVSEFKQWLSGVEDMQPTGWVPNEEQWKKIRAKIASLSEDVFEEIVQPAPAPQPVYHQPVPAYAPPHPLTCQCSLSVNHKHHSAMSCSSRNPTQQILLLTRA